MRLANRKKPTVADVANLAGVHPSTVSRALSPVDRHRISADVATRVQAAADTLGYRPNGIAAGLRSGRTRMVGVLLPDIANTVFAPILAGVEATLNAAGYVMIVANVGRDADRQREMFERLAAHQIGGLIMATAARRDPLVAAIAARGLPLVLVNRATEARATPSVVSDDGLGMALAVRHLVDLGHRRIAHLGGPVAYSTGHARRAGFLAAMKMAGLDPPLVVAARAYGREEGRAAGAALLDKAAGAALLDKAAGATGIVAANDLLALGLIDAARARGLACPDDLSIVGHNDMPMMDAISPPLTTVRIRHQAMGEEAARLLIRAMAGETEPLRIVLTPELVIRASTRAISGSTKS